MFVERERDRLRLAQQTAVTNSFSNHSGKRETGTECARGVWAICIAWKTDTQREVGEQGCKEILILELVQGRGRDTAA